MQVNASLPDLPKNMSEHDLEREMWAHVNSKYSNDFKIKVLKEQTNTDGIACLVNMSGDVSITFSELNKRYYKIPSLKNQYVSEHTFNIGLNDLIMFPSNTKYKIDGDGAKLMIFKIEDMQEFGNGSNQYRVEVTFSDTYYIIVNADNEEDAKNIAYDIDTSNWVHEWPKDSDLERVQNTRMSRWGRKNLRSFKI